MIHIPANKPPNTEYEYKIFGDYTEIYLYWKKEKHTVTIDTKNLDKFLQCPYRWVLKWDKHIQSFYVFCSLHIDVNKSKTIMLHRYLLGIENSKIMVDHIDNNSLNNLEGNLRTATISQNGQNRKGKNCNNTTGHRNVNWGNSHKYYVVRFMKDRIRYQWEFPLNKYQEACDFADIKRIELFGEFAGKS